MRCSKLSGKFYLVLFLCFHCVNSIDYSHTFSYASNVIPRGGGSEEEVCLNFEGSFRDCTPTLPNASSKLVEQFFQDPQNRNLVLKGGANPTQQVVATDELYDQWKKQASFVKSSSPSPPHDPVILISSTVTILPGLSIAAKSWMGCKLLHHEKTRLPIYEFTLIKDDYKPEGVKFMVWLFNQVTGNNDKNDSSDMGNSNRQTHGLSRIFIEPPTDDSKGLVMHYFGFVKVSCTVPRRVLRFLPLSKAKAEQRVSNAIVKQLKSEGVQSLRKFQTAFEEWLPHCQI